MTDSEKLDKILEIWMSPKWANVMLPGLGSMTCGEIACLIKQIAVKAKI